MERYMHRSPCTPVLPKWKRTKINSKKNCIFRFQSVASNAEKKTTESKGTSSVLPTQNLLFV